MKTSGRVLAAILMAIAVTQAREQTRSTPGGEAVEKTLLANERALYDAVAKANKASFLSLVLPDGVWATKQGWIPMNLLADGLEQFNLSRWDIVNPTVTLLAEDAAIVLYTWTGSGTFDNQPLAPATLASTVWTRRNGKWTVAHHQQTDLARQ